MRMVLISNRSLLAFSHILCTPVGLYVYMQYREIGIDRSHHSCVYLNTSHFSYVHYLKYHHHHHHHYNNESITVWLRFNNDEN